MCYRLIRWMIASYIYLNLIGFPPNATAETNEERRAWTYQKEVDKLTNLTYSLVRSPMPKRNQYDNIRLEITCKANKLQFIAQTSALITSQDREFDFEYQIDKKPSTAIKLRTFKDSKYRGYSDEKVDQIAGEFLSGESIFIRINTIISSVLTAEINLKDATKPIQQVLTDCGIVAGKAQTQQAYSLTEFVRDFAALTPEQRAQTLEEIKKIMSGIR